MRKILGENSSPTESLAKMFQLVTTNPEYLSRRISTIHVIAETLLSLYKCPNDETIIRESMEKLIKMKEDISQFRVANSVVW